MWIHQVQVHQIRIRRVLKYDKKIDFRNLMHIRLRWLGEPGSGIQIENHVGTCTLP